MIAPGSLQEIVDEWQEAVDRPIFLIDETRRSLRVGEHREAIVFIAVCCRPPELVKYLIAMDELRCRLPPDWEDTKIKGTDIWHLDRVPEYSGVTQIVRSVVLPPTRIFIAATSQQHLNDSRAKVRFTVVPEGKVEIETKTGAQEVIQGRELPLASNLILRLCKELNMPARVDVVIDRSGALGLRPPPPKMGRLLYGQLKDGTSDVCMVIGSDDDKAKDLLLPPDFCGNALLHKSKHRLQPDLDTVIEREPFWIREILALELTTAIDDASASAPRDGEGNF